MIRKALVTSSVALIFCSASTVMAGPPVKVEVVVEDEDDFFEEKKAKPKTKTDEVREHANEMFDELEKEEQKHKNDNTNVVNVVVVDGEKKQEETQIETPETPDVPPVVEYEHEHGRHHRHRLTREERRRLRHEERMARLREKEERRMQKLRLREEKLRLRHQELQMRQDLRCQKLEYRGWWNRPSWAEGGDFLLHGVLGFNGQGAFGGIGGEFFATDVLGIRAQAQFMRLGHDDDPGFTGPNFNVNHGGVWANANDVDYRNLRSGHTHLLDAMLAVHVIPESRFDLFPTVGFSYMGYGFNYGDEDRNEKGGAGYLRVGAGFNIVVKRFYAGLDFGWYPVEIFHHGTDRRDVAQLNASLLPDDGEDRDRDNDDADDDGDGRGRFNAKRMTLTAHLGIRF